MSSLFPARPTEGPGARIRVLLVVLFAVGLVPVPAAAQSFDYGAKGGLALSTISSEYPDPNLDPEFERRRGLTLFLFGEWRATSILSFVGEVGYAQRGYRDILETRNPMGEPTGERAQVTSFGYAATAALGKLRYPAAVTPYLLAGPHLGVLLHSSFDSPFYDASENQITRQYDTLTYGATVGVGLETDRLFFGRAFLEVRYDADISDSLSEAPVEFRNRALDVLVGLSF